MTTKQPPFATVTVESPSRCNRISVEHDDAVFLHLECCMNGTWRHAGGITLAPAAAAKIGKAVIRRAKMIKARKEQTR